MKRLLTIVGLTVSLGACSVIDSVDDYVFSTQQDPPLPGQRLSILAHERGLEVDPRLAQEEVVLPEPYLNKSWLQAGGVPSNALHHLGVTSETLAVQWRVSIGQGSDSDLRLISMPIVVNGVLYAMDAESRVAAMDAKTGKRLWRVSLVPPSEEADNSLGGGLAFFQGRLYATTGFGDVFALDGRTGGLIWRTEVGEPFRAAPTVSNGAVLALSYDNQLHALRADSGEVVWTHTGVVTEADVMGGAAPAISQGKVVAAYSSGELLGLDLATGDVLWSDSLVRRGRLTALQSLADINALPVVDRGRVFSIGHSGRMVSLDLESGVRYWDRDLGGVETPWVAGDYIYLVTNEADVICLTREEGRIKWITKLPRYERPQRRRDPIQWSGPLLVSDRLVVLSSVGEAWALSPYTGKVMGYEPLPDPTYLAPIVADGWVYILTDDGDIVALN